MDLAILVGFVDEALSALAVVSHHYHDAAVARARQALRGTTFYRNWHPAPRLLALMVKQALERCGPRFAADIDVQDGRALLTFRTAVRYKKPFYEALKRNEIPCLDSLSLDEGNFDGFAATLRTATFRRLGVHTRHARDLCDIFVALAHNSSLLSLECCDCSFTGDEWPSLKHGLAHNTTMLELNLGFNRVDLSVFARSHLRALGLAFCDIDTSGALRLADALRRNSTLVWLNLVGNHIATRGFVEIITNSSTRLAFLALDRNSHVDKREIADARRNKPLYVDILDSTLTRPCCRKLLRRYPLS